MSVENSASLASAQAYLGWPSADDIFRPSGAPARALTGLIQAKFGQALTGQHDARNARIGMLMPAAEALDTETPIAIVVEFQTMVSSETVRELQRLAWNFSQTPALITVEPGLIRVWSCCIAPESARPLSYYLAHEMGPPTLLEIGLSPLERSAATAIHWVNLISGQFFRDRPSKFDRNGQANNALLENLMHVRAALVAAGLSDEDVCHDLLARIIFVQFLFDRKDLTGTAALSEQKLLDLRDKGVLVSCHSNLASVLRNYQDTYALFDWLNDRFNGDLFPGKGCTAEERSAGWRRERGVITEAHLTLLADFVGGTLQMPAGQGCLWPQYSFDVIPLDFISSIYESFVAHKKDGQGVYYTPPALVDFVLDLVLPWAGKAWDIKVMDPSCGSGIFLVKAFQRLVFRWKEAHPGRPIPVEVLRGMLEINLFGIDKDPHAVRVACFSLYLAMCDEIDPRQYWNDVKFPTMRERRLVAADFFDEKDTQLRKSTNGIKFDLVIGNAPWGSKTVTREARDWAGGAGRRWPIANNDIGTLFLPKAAEMLSQNGRVALIQPAAALLFNKGASSTEFRRLLFSTFHVEKVINLSAVRFKLFGRKNTAKGKAPGPVAPACIVVMTSAPADPSTEVIYISPKATGKGGDAGRIIVLASDTRRVSARDAAMDADVWPALMWGTSRDLFLLRRLRELPTLAHPGGSRSIVSREGIILGDKKKSPNLPPGTRLFKADAFPLHPILTLDAGDIPEADDIRTHSRDSTDLTAFASPQLLVKQTFRIKQGRFQARTVTSKTGEMVLATQSYVSMHDPSGDVGLLDAACMAFNSKVAAYFLFLTSGRFASYRPEVLAEELLNVPIPPPKVDLLKGVTTLDELDARMFSALRLKPAEIVLVEDLLNYTLLDAKSPKGPGLKKTTRELKEHVEPELKAYCEHFVRVLKAGSAGGVPVSATIFQDTARDMLPFRLVAFELGHQETARPPMVRRITTPQLLDQLRRLSRRPGMLRHQVIRIYETIKGRATVFIIKPDEARHWTRSLGLADADEVSLDLLRWYQSETATTQETAA